MGMTTGIGWTDATYNSSRTSARQSGDASVHAREASAFACLMARTYSSRPTTTGEQDAH